MNKIWIFLSGGGVIVIWSIALIASLCISSTIDPFNAVTALFSGLGFVGLIATLIMQRQQFHADSRMNAISTIINNRKVIVELINGNDDRKAKYGHLIERILEENIEKYKELLNLISHK